MKSKIKVLQLIFLGNMLLLTQAVLSAEYIENPNIIAETGTNQMSKQIVDDKPVVIHTELQYYDQPTLKEYQECHENLEKCKTACEGSKNVLECVKECPVCPYLIQEKIVVQGFNDTDFAPVPVKPLNTTNIIRLTNHIRNIIETHQGNITNINENIVHVHQNTSKVGGKFGLGYDNSEPCCIAVRSAKNCDIKPFSSATLCHHKRHRVCGKQCKSRVMVAKRITLCEKSASYLTNEDYSEGNCQETVRYVPYQHHTKQYTPTHSSRNRCTFSPSWPYVLCGHNGEGHNVICRHCLHLPYYYILQRGIPARCTRCFNAHSNPIAETYPPWYPIEKPNIEDNDYFDSGLSGWRQDKTKCILPNGSVSDNCQEIQDTDARSITSDPWDNSPSMQDEYLEYNTEDEEILDNEYNPRNRRQTFTRSKYSRRQA